MAVRPRWIAALVLALAVAAAFAALGQWQLERSFANSEAIDRATETAVPLDTIAEPQQPTMEAAGGQLVTVTGSFVPGDSLVLSERLNDGERGYWLVGHFVVDGHSVADTHSATDGVGLGVAVGWAETEAEASAAISTLEAPTFAATTLMGRYLPSEAPQTGEFEAGELSAMSMPALVNLWQVGDRAVYDGYVVANVPIGGLTAIHSPPPSTDLEINWLNIFYAAEWVVFAGFAVFLWYRLVKDAWEKEQHEKVQEAQLN